MKFKRRKTLSREHAVIDSEGTRRRQCPLCGKTFSAKSWPKHEAEEEARIDAQARLRRVRDSQKK